MAKRTRDYKIFKPLLESLADDGERAIKFAYKRRNYMNQTYNLHDSYVSAVFVDGVLYRDTIRYVGARLASPSAAPNEMGDYVVKRAKKVKGLGGDGYLLKGDTVQAEGRLEAYRFLLDYESSIKGTEGIQLVTAATMYYAPILEGKMSKLFGKYVVISTIVPFLRSLKRKYGSECTLSMFTATRLTGKLKSRGFEIENKVDLI